MHCFLQYITVFIESGMLLSEFGHFSTARVNSVVISLGPIENILCSFDRMKNYRVLFVVQSKYKL